MQATTTPEDFATPGGNLGIIDQLLRDRPSVHARIQSDDDLAGLARAMVLTILAGAAVMGATMGFYRGGIQVLFAGIKLPLAMLLTAGICTPAWSALCAAVQGKTSVRRDFATVLVSLALTSLLLAAMAPVVMLFITFGASYHSLILLVVCCCGLAGLGGLSFFMEAARRREGGRRPLIILTLLCVFAGVGSQLTWALRPFLVRPRAPEVVFVRSLEGSFLEAVSTSVNSARGRYTRDAAPLPGRSR